MSQCCLTKHVFKMSKQYLANVALKINVKVGGRNTVLVDAISRRIPLVSDRPTIIFGADVTHPHPGEDSSPSIAAVSIFLCSCLTLNFESCNLNSLLLVFGGGGCSGCCFSRLARSHEVCWFGFCSSTSSRAYSRSLQNMARS